ncbi:hypothetical protein KKB40_02330 [Patescibacteria group bacterium]|nr:hypothetical protein [Patescibacteria group bacterium]
MNSIPKYITKYLWDVEIEKLDLQNHSVFIIERVLEYGDLEALWWINKSYKKDIITSTLKKSKKISSKSGNFYALFYNIPREKLLCIRKPFTQKQNRF